MYKVVGINVAKVEMHIAPTRPVNRSSFGIAAARTPAKRDEAFREISIRGAKVGG